MNGREADAQTFGAGENGTQFTWNKRTCWGKTLHEKALKGDEEGVRNLLDADVNDPRKEGADISLALVRARFAWIVPYGQGMQRRDQLCTGQAIHLAASRGHVALLRLLIERMADLNSQVTRDNQTNYGVLQAAIFRGGSGGSRQMIEMLCSERGADISRTNANGDTGLHLAFSTGNEETILAVYDLMKSNKCEKGSWVFEGDRLRDESPLEIGIRSGMMNRESLARMAHCAIMSGMLNKKSLAIMAQCSSVSPCYIASLKLFINRAPECIPSFLELWGKREELAEALWPEQKKEGTIPENERLTSDDLQKMLRDCPGAGKALMESSTFRPDDRSDGYNKLPERVSLAPRNLLSRLLGLSPFCFRFKCFYETDTEWKEERKWHSQLTTERPGRPEEMKEIKIVLCRVPDIITPGFFSAVLDARDGDKPALFLFQSLPVRAAVSFTFWKGAVWMDMLQFIFSLWGLALLITMTWYAQDTEFCPEGLANPNNGNNATEAVLNRTQETNQTAEEVLQYLCNQQLASIFKSSLITDIRADQKPHERAVVGDWIIAKGFVDLLLEALQFGGCVATKQIANYFRSGNLWDVFRSILPILLLRFHACKPLQILVVLMYWMRLLEGATLSQKIGHALLPLQNLVYGLFPAMLFTILGFGALTHALYAVHNQTGDDRQQLWPGAVWKTFARLIAQELDDDKTPEDMELLVLLFGVLFFSVFMMNVFIGVINDQYSEEKKTVRTAFQSLRAKSCLTHLLRMSAVPCDLLTAQAAACLSTFCVMTCIVLQVLALGETGWQLPDYWQFFAFLLLKLCIFLASFQCKGSEFPWLTFIRGNPKTRYLWICEPRDYGEIDDDKMMPLPRTSTRSMEHEQCLATVPTADAAPTLPTLLTSRPLAHCTSCRL
eukprot:s1084_g19.t1